MGLVPGPTPAQPAMATAAGPGMHTLAGAGTPPAYGSPRLFPLLLQQGRAGCGAKRG